MLEKTEENILKFKNKIVFAPNGFGKTQFSNYLVSELKNQGKQVAFFTNKEISQLIRTNETTIYYGEAANFNDEKATLKNAIETSESLKSFLKDNYKNFTLFKGCLFGKINSKMLRKNDADAWLSIISSNNNLFFDNFEPDSKYIKLDKILSHEIYEECLSVVESIDNYVDECLKNSVIDDDTVLALKRIKAYAEGREKLACPLCGHPFDSLELLLNSIDTTISNYTTETAHKISMSIDSISLKIRKQLSEFDIIKAEFDGLSKNNELVKHYFELCVETLKNVYNQIGNIRVLNNNLFDVSRKINSCNESISTVVTNYKNKPELLSYIEESIRNLFVFRTNISLIFNNEDMSFKLIDENSEFPVEENLSESEMKRLSLIILKALVKFFNYDSIVLDDPIDSYDDYYLAIACNFISDIINEDCINKDWYLFTNNVNCLSSISIKTKSNAIISTDNPNIIFNSTPISSIEIPVEPDEFEILNSNELCLMSKYLNPNLPIYGLQSSFFSSSSLPFIAFIVTCRNFNDVVNRNYDKVNFYLNFCNDKRMQIEHCFMHYDDIGVTDSRGVHYNTSSHFLISNMYTIYNELITINNPNINALFSSSTPCIDERANILHSDYSLLDGSQFLNYIFYKILAMSEIRFKLEKKIVNFLSTLSYITRTDIDGFILTDCLGSKIDYLSRLASRGSEINSFSIEVNKVYKKHSTIINEFDHALNQMFPPYISTSSIDIKNLNDMVDSL